MICYLDPFSEASVFVGIFGVGIENILNIGLAIGEIQSLDVWHGGEHADDGLIGIDIGHGMFRVGRMRMDAELTVNEALDAGLETVFETVITSSSLIIYSTPGEVATSINQRIHFRMNNKVILHGALAHGHLGFVSALREAIVAERNDSIICIDNCATHFGRRILGLGCRRFGDLHEIFVPIFLRTHILIINWFTDFLNLYVPRWHELRNV